MKNQFIVKQTKVFKRGKELRDHIAYKIKMLMPGKKIAETKSEPENKNQK